MLSMMAWGTARLVMGNRGGLLAGPEAAALPLSSGRGNRGGGGAPRHWDSLARLCAEHAGDMSPQELSNCIWALAAVGHSRRSGGRGDGYREGVAASGGGGVGGDDDSWAVLEAMDVLLKRAGVLLDRFNETVRGEVIYCGE